MGGVKNRRSRQNRNAPRAQSPQREDDGIREQRHDSVISDMGSQAREDALRKAAQKATARPTRRRAVDRFRVSMKPPRWIWSWVPPRIRRWLSRDPESITICIIFLLLVFGAMYAMVEYLLSSTRAMAQCTASTVYVPVPTTETVTTVQYIAVSGAEAMPIASTSEGDFTSTSFTTVSTTTMQVTQTVTMPYPSEGPSEPGPSFSYHVSDGVTNWLGNTPSSGASLAMATVASTVPVTPVADSAPPAETLQPEPTTTISSTSTITSTTTVSPFEQISTPTYTFAPITSTSFVLNDGPTTTLTSTSYRTRTVLAASHSSFTGVNSAGWNVSTSALATNAQPRTTTISELHYLGDGTATTLTTTQRITTTIGAALTRVFVPPPSLSSLSGSPTLISQELTTMTWTVTSDVSTTSTSLGFAGSAGSTVASQPQEPTGTASSSLSTSYEFMTTTNFLSSSDTTSGTATTGISTYGGSANTASSSTSIITITSFVAGHGTTFVVQSTPVGTTPYLSPSPNSTFGSTAQSISGPRPSQEVSSLVSSPTPLNPPTSSASDTVSGVSATGQSSRTPVGSDSTTTANTLLQGSRSSSARDSGSASSTMRVTSALPSAPFTTLPFSTTTLSSPSSSSRASSRASNSSATRASSLSTKQPEETFSPASSPSSLCGEQGDFTMTFDDLPRYTPTKRQTSGNQTNSTDVTQYPPLAAHGAYHHLFFSNGYVYAPSEVEPFSPVSWPNVAAFINPMRAGGRPTGKNNVEQGEIGAATRDDDPAYWFDAKTTYLGCDNAGPHNCTIEATGYKWSQNATDEVRVATMNFTLPPCEAYENCKLEQVRFPSAFRNLTGVQFRAIVDNEPRMFFVDNLSMRWSDSSCEAGNTRAKSIQSGQ